MEHLIIVLFISALVVMIHGNKLPKALQEVVDRQRRTGDNSNWCCEDDTPVNMIKRSRTKVEQIKVTEQIKTGSETCKIFFTCTKYELIYRTEPQFSTEYYAVPHKEACPDEAVKCCKGFLLIVGNCLSLEEISMSGMTIEELIKSKLMEEN
ncbi:uncharacterized protein LOC135486110 isoform X1 [Lineus longissimus]|uniref:uncharacterized protein LOC135486110 isoform X1 n=1 Tax=Lineus longissimus TaxID=88925 RepID=UPI002B4E9A92